MQFSHSLCFDFGQCVNDAIFTLTVFTLVTVYVTQFYTHCVSTSTNVYAVQFCTYDVIILANMNVM